MISPSARTMQIAPAPGFRDAGSTKGYGVLWNVGNSGYSWSSTIPTGSGYARCLDFYAGGVHPQASTARAYGFPLRCLQE